jgi:radical SAM-linked protein
MTAPLSRLRIRYAKLGRIRWTSHRDVARMWERALRRAAVPLAYTEGFSPRPQLSFGLALPTGCESTAEYLDAALRAAVSPAELTATVTPLLPDGLHLVTAAVLEPGSGSLQEEVTSCRWEIELPGLDLGAAHAAVDRALGAGSLPVRRERKGRQEVDDLRPSVLALDAVPDEGAAGVTLVAELATKPRGVRPSELADALAVSFGRARRTHQWIERDEQRVEPLGADALVPALGRAS